MLFTPIRLGAVVLAAGILAACDRAETAAPASPAASETEAGPASTETAASPVQAAAKDAHGDDHDHDHDHGEDGAAGGRAHVHGIADLAITLEGNQLMGELIAPMANFGIAESSDAFTDDVKTKLPGLIELAGGDCRAGVPHPMTDKSGDHTDAIVHFVWTCARPEDLRGVRFTGFRDYPGFETINAVFITPTQQVADDLTPAKPELSLK